MISLISEYKSSFRLRGWSNLSWMCFHEILSVLYDSKRLQSCETKMWSTKSFIHFLWWLFLYSSVHASEFTNAVWHEKWLEMNRSVEFWAWGDAWQTFRTRSWSTNWVKHMQKLEEIFMCVCVDIYRTSSDVRVDVNHTKHMSALFWDRRTSLDTLLHKTLSLKTV